jgi:hypothetical protein
MTNKQKETIVSHLEHWLDINGFSANEFSEKYNIPANYISLIRNGKFEVPTGNGSSPISDKYFRLIAEAVGLQLGNQITWKFKEHKYTSLMREDVVKLGILIQMTNSRLFEAAGIATTEIQSLTSLEAVKKYDVRVKFDVI